MFRWQGHPVGIARTEVELARHFLNDVSPQSRTFCITHRKQRQILEISDEQVRNRLNEIDAGNGSGSSSAPNKAGLIKKLLKGLKQFVGQTISRLFPTTSKQLKATLRESYSSIRVLRTVLIHEIRSYIRKPPSFGFKSSTLGAGDTYVALGLDWDDKDERLIWPLKKQGVRIARFCYDLIPVNEPQFVPPGNLQVMDAYFAELMWNSDILFCISEFTATAVKDYCERMTLPLPQTKVVYLGQEITRTEPSSVTSSKVAKDKFFLSVGTLEPRKNYELLYFVWRILRKKLGNECPILVIVGRPGWNVDNLLYKIKCDPKVCDYIQIHSNVSDEKLHELYLGSTAVLVPSFCEGWGLPAAEAASLGKVVVYSNASALPEATQGFGLPLDPDDPKAWSEAILKLLDDSSWHKELENKTRTGFHIRSWKEFAGSVARELLVLT